MKLKLVEIEWTDADGESGWSHYEPDQKLVTVKTYGLLINNDWRQKDHIAHADSYCKETKMWSGVGRIPKSMVKKVRIITTVDV